MDADVGKNVMLIPAQKLAIVTTYTKLSAGEGQLPKEKGHLGVFFELRSQLVDARSTGLDSRATRREEIDGRRLLGCRLTGHGMILDLWGDPKTGMPVRIESERTVDPQRETDNL